jgi:hypothetical protein
MADGNVQITASRIADSLHVQAKLFLPATKEFLLTAIQHVIAITLIWSLYPYQTAINSPNTKVKFGLRRTASFEPLCNAMLLCIIFRKLYF